MVLSFASCKDSSDYDNKLEAVKTIIEPIDGKAIVLQPTDASSVYFEWDHVKINNGGPVLYQIAFDKEDGDFSNPVFVKFSDNNGYNNSASISHKQLNKIAGMAGYAPSTVAPLKWTVFATKGINAIKSSEENSIIITRLAGFPEEEIPIDLFITGEASEGGSDLSKAQKFKAVSNGEFEIYTQLKGGESYKLVSRKSEDANVYSTADNIVVKEGESSVEEDGVYKLTLDFNTGAATITIVESIGFFFSPSDKILFELPYIGNGVFKAEKQIVEFKDEGSWRDQRYKFRMFVRENSGNSETKELEWATLNSTDSSPNSSSPESYYYLRLTDNITQWDNKWKLMDKFDKSAADYTIYLQADNPYTHSVK